jgi:hypothetical protein
MRVAAVNIRSMYKNGQLLEEINMKLDCDLMCISETWEKPGLPISMNNMQVISHTYREKSIGGGSMILAKRDILATDLAKYSINIEKEIELCTCIIKQKGQKTIILISLYLGFLKRDKTLERLISLIRDIKKEYPYAQLLMAGDTNINTLKLDNHDYIYNFVTELESCMLLPSISQPTRIQTNKTGMTSYSCVDNIYANDAIDMSSHILIAPLSDHYLIFCDLKRKIKRNTSTVITYRDLSDDNIKKAEALLYNQNMLDLLTSNDVNFIADTLQDRINNCIQETCPIIEKRVKNQNIKPPWFTRGFVTSSRRQYKLYLKWQNCKTINKERHLQTYKEYSKLYASLKRAAINMMAKTRITNAGSNIRLQWKMINELLNRKTTSQQFPAITTINGTSAETDEEKAAQFNQFFATIATTYSEKFDNNNNWSSYTDQKLTRFNFKQVTIASVQRIIGKLATKRSTGWDTLSNALLKRFSYILAPSITHLVNTSLRTGNYPDKFKVTRVCPLWKSKDKQDMNNYRPVTLSPTLSKVLERVVANQTRDYLERNNLLPAKQYGFRTKMQINHLLYDLVQNICEKKSSKQKMAAIFIDLSKAFDCLDHRIYKGIIRQLGFSSKVQTWFHNYLCNRKQYVNINAANSEQLPINIGTPQGSVLGPLIFLIYVQSLQNVLPKDINYSYADDTTLLFSEKTDYKLKETIETYLPRLQQWFIDHKLTINAGKTRIMHIDSNPGPIRIDNEELKVVSEFKLLGIWLDNKLNWHKQTNYTIQKIKPVIYHLRKLRYTLDINNKKLLYNGLVNSRLCYGIPIWMGVSNTLQTRLQILQNKAMRAVFGLDYRDSVANIMVDNKILNVTNTSIYMSLLLVKSIVSNQKLCNLIPEKEESRLRASTNKHVITPFYKTSLLQQQSCYLCPRLWNIFSIDIRELQLVALKNNLKNILLQIQAESIA